jgi:class 3 adenylate cyclase
VERALADDLQRTITALDSLHHTLVTFLPRYLLDLSPSLGQPHGELLEGSFIFADVTGFTALTGELSKRGTEGREEMNRLMRRLFAALLDPLLTSGGDLLIFAGDAVLASFTAQPDGRDAAWAARTALRLVRAISPFAHLETPYGTFSLTMSAGVERGRAFAGVVGTRQRMELLISGGPVQGAMTAEGAAAPGDVVAGPGIRPLLRDDHFVLEGQVVVGLQDRDLDDYETVPPARRRRRMSSFFSRQIPDLIDHLRQALEQVESLVPFIPPDLFTQIARGEDVRQHPPVAVQFVNLLGFEDLALGPAGPERATAALQRTFVQAQEIVSDREGIVSQVDPYAHGFTLLNSFGAPAHHEGVPRLAAAAALELRQLLEQVNREFELDPPLTQRIGLTYDRIFTGEIGYHHRREYVVAGPAVNLAARLMSKADPGQIVLDPLTWEQVQDDFSADDLPPIPLKGIPDPVPRFDLRGFRQGRGLTLTDYPLVDREAECAALEERLADAMAGHGATVALIGETGIGKSRLTTALIETAQAHGVTVLLGRCRAFGQGMPYLPWLDLVSDWFDLDREAPPDLRRRQLREQLSEFDLLPSLPAFADLLGLPPALERLSPSQDAAAAQGGIFAKLQPDSTGRSVSGLADLLKRRVAEAASSVDQRPSVWEILSERSSIPQALMMLLERQACCQPTLIVLEDLQWIDPASREILECVAASASDWPLLVLVTGRPDAAWPGETFSLDAFSPPYDEALAALALRATCLAPDLGGWLRDRTAGNPLFILSYCRALRDADAVVVDPSSGMARWSGPPPTLPLSLQELLLAQVGRLRPASQEALRRGAVVGDSFPTWLLETLYRQADAQPRLKEALAQAARRSLIAPPPPESAHAFTSSPLHEAVYETLSHSLRRRWHEQLGDALADTGESTRYERLERIAHHYYRSDNVYKASRFTRLAGDKARTRQADQAARVFYAQTLKAAGGSDEDRVMAEWRLAREGLGDIYALGEDPTAARVAYRAALLDAPVPDAGRLRAKLALLSPLLGDTTPEAMATAARDAPSSGAWRSWLGAAQVWSHSARAELDIAADLCRDLLPAASEPVKSLLIQALENLEAEAPLAPYADLFALFSHAMLRCTPGGA